MLAASSCEALTGEQKEPAPDFDNIVLDGFYVYGEAVGIADAANIEAKFGMAAGLNEVTQEKRGGMYEKYVVLEAEKDFYLVLNEAGTTTNYGAELVDFDVKELADNPTYEGTVVKRGELKTGAEAPAMRVAETGLYHIVLDLNLEGDLLYPQIVVAKVIWGVRGGLNGWGFTPFDAVEVNAETMTWTLTDQEITANGVFKFAYGHGWKIQLDDAGNVKANTNLGADCVAGGADILVNQGGKYTIKLTYTLAGGDIKNSYSYELICTEKSELPTELYMIGAEFGNWDWAAESVVSMVPVYGQTGAFWTTRYFHAQGEGANEDGSTYKTNGFKFCPVKDWKGDFTNITENYSGYTVADGNCFVAEDGLYTVYVDLKSGVIAIEPAKVYGIGDAFGSWDGGVYPFTVAEDGTASIVTTAAGNLRMYTAVPEAVKYATYEWWNMEFNVFEGKIEYRGAGGDQAAVAVTAGQTVTLNFNAGTGSIQ